MLHDRYGSCRPIAAGDHGVVEQRDIRAVDISLRFPKKAKKLSENAYQCSKTRHLLHKMWVFG
jgi:hypothetical protein